MTHSASTDPSASAATPSSPLELRPSRLEIASGVVAGRIPGPGRPPFLTLPQPPALGPLAALQQAVLPALRRPPCLVSFSGSTGSSVVLAVAALLARQEGLRPPVPVTWRSPDPADAAWSTWQARVIAALPIADWPVLAENDGLDPLGPAAARILTSHGVLHPGSTDVALHLPIIERARGGSLLTGSGATRTPTDPDGPATRLPGITDRLISRAPAGWQRPGADSLPWLHPEVSHQVSNGRERDRRSEPRRLDRWLDWHARSRELLIARAALHTAAVDCDVLLVDPLLDGVFCTALQFLARRVRGRSGRELLLAVAAGTLPEVATAVRPRSPVPGPFLREPTRTFIREWDGSGVDGTLVNVTALRRLWSTWPVPAGTAGLVQQLWLDAQPLERTGSDRPVDRPVRAPRRPADPPGDSGSCPVRPTTGPVRGNSPRQ